MSLVADYSSASDSDENTNESRYQTTKQVEKLKLPSANFLLDGNTAGEVFSNPYKQAEQAKIAILERHVKMVSSDEHLKMKNGKKICWNYRKGRCRFGSNCSFAHDSDLNEIPKIVENNTEAVANIANQDRTSLTGTKVQQHLQPANETTIDSFNSPNEQLTTTSSKKRNRPGLSQTIVPSKRVLKAYSHQKQNITNHNQRKLT